MACLFAGLHATVSRERSLRILLPGIALPVLLMSLQGISHFPWAYARFMITSVPLLLIVMASGVLHVASCVGAPRRKMIAAGLATAVAVSWIPAMSDSFAQKARQPWHRVAGLLAGRRQEEDAILTESWLDSWQLQPYFSGDHHLSDAAGDPRPAVPIGDALYFVAADVPIRSEYSMATLGRIQILRYPNRSPDAALRLLREDVLQTVAARPIGAQWAPVYRALLELDGWLDLREGEDDYYYLWAQSEALTPERRFMPRRMRLESDRSTRQLAPPG
jgi:hypothetical protein